LLKLVTQISLLWSNKKFFIFLLQWFSTSSWNSLNIFQIFHTFPYQVNIHIYLLESSVKVNEVQRSTTHGYT
jgi:hypothetical protein